MIDHKKIIDKVINRYNNKDPFVIVVIGNNGAGKTTFCQQVVNEFNKKEVYYYTPKNNENVSDLNPFANSKDYRDHLLNVVCSSGESLYSQLMNIKNHKDIMVWDEPTASLDLKHAALVVESFIRSHATLKIISTNDYFTLKLLSSYVDNAYNVSTGKIESISEFVSNEIDATLKELNDSPFEEYNEDFYEDLKW